MKRKKFLYINVVFLLGNLLFSVLLIFWLYTTSCSRGFEPIDSSAWEGSFVGRLRLSNDITTNYLNTKAENQPIKLEFLEIAEGESSVGDDYVSIKAKQTVKKEVQHYTNYWLLHFCEEDGFWYLVYYSGYAERGAGYPAASQDPVNFDVPADVLSDSGQYAIVIKGLGCCLFEIS